MAVTGTGLPAARPTSGRPVAPAGRVSVVNLTWGTVTCVEMTDMMKEEEMGWPVEEPEMYVIGRVTVSTREMIVTGRETGAGAVIVPA